MSDSLIAAAFPPGPTSSVQSRCRAFVEVALIFAAFCLQGAWPVPDVNEPYYLGKAIHYWNPAWGQGDFFLESRDAHLSFYLTFGWLSAWLAPTALAWTGRLLTWGLLAWSWRRLSHAVVPRRWMAVLSGVLFAAFVERFHMSGEWIIGGVEAKGFSYILAILGLECMVRERWNRAWVLLGAASFVHILVGGWALIAAAFVWLGPAHRRPAIRGMIPGLLTGFLIALPSLIIALALDWGADAESVRRAHEIYVYYRLPHHLILQERRPEFILRFVGMILAWVLVCRIGGDEGPRRLLRGFVVGSLAIATIGAALSLLSLYRPALGASILRFYWFRLADVAVPMGLALHGVAAIDRLQRLRPRLAWATLAVAVLAASLHLADFVRLRIAPTIPRADAKTNRLGGYGPWAEACDWVSASGAIPEHARFLTPIDASTFKWRTARAEVVTRKEIPQDARSIVVWWDRLREIHGLASDDTARRYWIRSLTELGEARLKELGAKYQVDYVLTEAPGVTLPASPSEPEDVVKRLDLRSVYENRGFIIYQLDRAR